MITSSGKMTLFSCLTTDFQEKKHLDYTLTNVNTKPMQCPIVKETIIYLL